jgi:hypothetical protein
VPIQSISNFLTASFAGMTNNILISPNSFWASP